MSKVVAICNQKGGVGKTTTAINLAACLAMAGHPALILDLDPQGNATSGALPSRPRESATSRLLLNASPVDELITQGTIDGLAIICSSPVLLDIEEKLMQETSGPFRLKNSLQALTDRFHYILIDCPPSLGIFTQNAMNAADSILIPIQCEYFAMEGLAEVLRAVRRVRNSTNARIALEGILLTMYDHNISLAREVAREIKSYFAGSVYRTVIPRDERLAEATSFGVPIIQYDATSRGAWAYIEFAREFKSSARAIPLPIF